jgi:DNA-binding CsgD family transcriptional regulator
MNHRAFDSAVSGELVLQGERACNFQSDTAVAGFLQALDVAGHGGVLLSHEGRVIALNAKARSFFGSAFVLSSGRISGLDESSNGALQRLLAQTHQSSAPAKVFACDPALLRKRDGSFLITYASRCGGPDEQLLIIFFDPDERREPVPAILQQWFGLTAAETKIAIELVRGGGLRHIAKALHVAEATLRSQLKSILAKTNTHRQAELVALLVRIAQANLSSTSSHTGGAPRSAQRIRASTATQGRAL